MDYFVLGVCFFYIFFILSIIVLFIGIINLDPIMLVVATCLFMSAFLIKSEFKITVKFWQRID